VVLQLNWLRIRVERTRKMKLLRANLEKREVCMSASHENKTDSFLSCTDVQP
jgi:hypothetical protein